MAKAVGQLVMIDDSVDVGNHIATYQITEVGFLTDETTQRQVKHVGIQNVLDAKDWHYVAAKDVFEVES